MFKVLLIIPLMMLSLICKSANNELVIYTSRKEHLVKPIFERFTKETGINVNYRTGKDGILIQTIKTENKNSPADILITVDAGNLWYAKSQGILETVKSKQLLKNIPAHLRDVDNNWFAFSIRARTIVYHQDRVDPKEIISYENLASNKWKGRLCLRTSKKVYNQSLVSMLIHELGEEKAKEVVSGWTKNAVTITKDDTKLLKAIEAGQCDVGIANTYYLGRQQRKNANFPVKIFWPNQKSYGVHINVSGAGIIKHSKNKKLAQKFLEWLSDKSAQQTFAQLNLEFPVRKDVPLDPLTKNWGSFIANKTFDLNLAGKYQAKAIKLMNEVGYK
jgi:iron(III) transport system substrate-binding protein